MSRTMRVDGNIGGSIDGTGGADLAGISDQVAAAKRVGYDGVWTTEVSRDSFLSLLLAADRSPGAEAGHRGRGGVRTEPDDRGHHRHMICSEDCAGWRVDDLELAAQRLDIAACHPWNRAARCDASSTSARSGAPVGRAVADGRKVLRPRSVGISALSWRSGAGPGHAPGV